jgi:hypothetical protein
MQLLTLPAGGGGWNSDLYITSPMEPAFRSS